MKKLKYCILIISILIIALIISVLIKRTDIQYLINDKAKMNMSVLAENNSWDISKDGDGSIIATLSADGTLTISGTGEMKDWNINDSTDWHNNEYIDLVKNVVIEDGITSIGSWAFYGCRSLTNIELPEGLTSIGRSAFYGCRSLTNIEIPEGVTSIGSYAFSDCSSLTNIKLPEGLTSIEERTFDDCSSLTNIELPEGLTSIDEYVFYSCNSLTNIELPKGLTSIEDNTFFLCSSLSNIKVDINNTEYMDDEGVLYTKDGKQLLQYPPKKEDISYIVLETVTSIGKYAFDDCSSLTNIELPKGLISIGEYSFWDCSSLTNIEIPERVTSMGSYAFYGCSSLTNIELPEGLTSIGSNAFNHCSSLTNIEIPEGVTSIGSGAFSYCSSLTNIELPEGLTSIEVGTFYHCSHLTNIEIPEGLTSIGDNAFDGCSSLTNIEIPEGVTSIGDRVFNNCISLTNIEIPKEVTSIGNMAFYDCSSLTNIELPKGLTSIGEYAFYGCSSLTNIELPKGMTSIGKGAFGFCTSLEEIKIPEGVTSIGEYMFSLCSSLTKAIIPKTVTTIASNAFGGYKNLNILCASNSTAESYAIEKGLNYTLDDIAPNVEISNNGTNNPVKQMNTTVTVTDNLSGVSSTKYLWSTKSENVQENEITNVLEEGQTITTPKETGEYYLWILVEDKVGNKAITKSNVFNIDNTAPTLEIQYTPNTYTKENVTAKITANEEIQGVAGWTLSVDKRVLTKEYTENTEETITVMDLAGNETTQDIQINKIDRENPTISLSSNGTVETVKEANTTVTVTDNLSGVSSIKYLWSTKSENVQESEITNVLEGQTITTPKATGEYYLWLLVEDNAGNKAITKSNLFNLDNTAPEGEVQYNISGDKKSCLVTISSNEELQEVTGWTLSVDKQKLTKEYTENIEESIEIKDKVGNITEVKIKITGIEEPMFKVKEYIIKGTYIRNIQPQTVYSNFIKNIVTNQSYEIKEGNITITGIDKIKTGQKLILKNTTYTLVVTGDINGDGDIKLSDLSTLKMQLTGKRSLTGASKEAGDINEDGDIKLSDLSKMKKIIIE